MGGVDHDAFRLWPFAGEGCENPVKHAEPAPADEPVVKGLVRAIAARRILPLQTEERILCDLLGIALRRNGEKAEFEPCVANFIQESAAGHADPAQEGFCKDRVRIDVAGSSQRINDRCSARIYPRAPTRGLIGRRLRPRRFAWLASRQPCLLSVA
jgi:hypothetical protein